MHQAADPTAPLARARALARARGARPPRPPAAARLVRTAVLLATAPAGEGGPAAALAWEDTTLVGRLLDQLAALGIAEAHVVTRPRWASALAPALAGHATAVQLHESEDAAGDLRVIAAVAAAGRGAVVVANADILTQQEALNGLLADPRVATGMLATTVRRVLRLSAFRTRSRRGRIVSAGSPYHYIHQPNGTFLSVLKVAAADRPALADVAARLAALREGPLPEGWQEELAAKAGRWKLALYRRGLSQSDEAAAEELEDQLGDPPAGPEGAPGAEDAEPVPEEAALAPEDVELAPEDAAELARRCAAAEQDVTSLVLCGLVRSHVQIGGSQLRRLFWARPLTAEDIARAAEEIGAFDEDRALLDSAVKANDGFFTTHFVSPYSKYVARWAAHRGWTPNGVTALSAGIGFLSAAAFATGERWGLVSGAGLLQVAFMFDCVDGQLARYTRTFSKFGAWLDSVFDRTKEYAVFAGLAIGAARTGTDVWLLAGAALALQTTRHAVDFSYPAAQHQALGAVPQPPLAQWHDFAGAAALSAPPVGDGDAPLVPEAQPRMPRGRPPLRRRLRGMWRRLDRSRRVRWVKKMIAFPIGERFAVISIAAACVDARAAFIALLSWGGFAFAYTVAGRVLRTLGRRGALAEGAAPASGPATLAIYRDDGPLSRALGRLLGRRLPFPPAALLAAGLLPAAAVAAVAAVAGDHARWGLAAAAVGWLVLAAGASSGRPLRDGLRWVGPPALRLAEYAGLLWLAALAGADAVPAAFALLCAVTFRHYDIVYRLRHRGVTPPRWLNLLAGGWDGRLLAGLALASAGATPAGLYAAAGVLGAVFAAESIHAWATAGRAAQPDAYEDEEEGAE